MLTMKLKIIAAAVLASVVLGWWQYKKSSLRDEGAQKLSIELQKTDTKIIKEKAKNDAEIRNKSDDSLLDEFGPSGLSNFQ